MTPKGKSFSAQLRAAIKENDFSPYKIARFCKIDEGNLNRFIHNKGGFRLKTLDKLIAFLGLQLKR